MRRRATGPPVALFPFLAVLLCAMGALILLLIILTRQVREDVLRTDATGERPDVPSPDHGPPDSIPVVVVLVPPPISEPPVDPNVALRHRLTALTADEAAVRREVERMRQAVAENSATLHSREARIASATFEAEATKQRLKARNIGIQEREAERRKLLDAIRRAEGNLVSAHQAAEAAEPKVTIVPYDGRHGTARRPVLVECTGSTIRFLPEGVELTASDIEGYQPDYNPLLAGVVALRRHWIETDGTASPKPYVLLLVREEGVAAYYAARAMLQSLDAETGYELVTDDLAIDVPEVDSAARAACRTAVLEVLQNRSPREASLARGESMFPTGRFEVDPNEHDPTQPDPSPFGDRPTADRNRPPLPPARPLGRTAETIDERPLPHSLQAERRSPPSPPSGADSLATAGSRPTVDRLPVRMPTGSTIEDSERDDDGLPMFGITNAKRRWGVNNPTANISLERPVSLVVTGDDVTVGLQPPIPIASGVDSETVRAVLAAIEKEAVEWGRAPGQFYWSPRLFAKVRPGATGHFDQLRLALGRAGLRTSGEIVLVPNAPEFLELNYVEAAP
ncbi:MAG: hypothetical protein WBC44_09810 [Planctomycetaceae bacterium]